MKVITSRDTYCPLQKLDFLKIKTCTLKVILINDIKNINLCKRNSVVKISVDCSCYQNIIFFLLEKVLS